MPVYPVACMPILHDDVKLLKDELASLMLAVSNQKHSYASAVSSHQPTSPSKKSSSQQGHPSGSNDPSTLPVQSDAASPRPYTQFVDRNLNVVVFGIPERSSGLPRKQRWLQDLKETTTLFTEPLMASIVTCRRLGKFSEFRERPRPILVNFNFCSVVVDILSNRSVFRPFTVKPDIPY